METDSLRISRASRPIIGTMVGVGILGLPYAVSRVGFVLGVVALFVVGVMSATVMKIYADLVLARGGHARFLRVVGRELGGFGTMIAGAAYLASMYGALVAYVIFGGQFLRTVLFPVLPVSVGVSMTLFFVLAALLTVGGTLAVSRAQRVVVPVFFLLVFALAILGLPYVDAGNFVTVHPSSLGAALGVMVFAFHGLSAIPEARDILGRHQSLLGKSILRSKVIVFAMYAMFIAVVVGVTGSATTENAVVGLGNILGRPAAVLVNLIALVVTLSAFMNIALALMNTYVYDLRMRVLPSWLATVSVPVVVVLAGASSISLVLNITGGVLTSLGSIMMLVAYERARMSAELPKNALNIPQWVVAAAFVLFAGLFVSTIFG